METLATPTTEIEYPSRDPPEEGTMPTLVHCVFAYDTVRWEEEKKQASKPSCGGLKFSQKGARQENRVVQDRRKTPVGRRSR